MVLHLTPTEAGGAEENRAGSRNVFFMRVLMSIAVAAGSCSRASREFQRGVEVISDSVASSVVHEPSRLEPSSGLDSSRLESLGTQLLAA